MKLMNSITKLICIDHIGATVDAEIFVGEIFPGLNFPEIKFSWVVAPTKI